MPRPADTPFWGESRASTWGYAELSGTSDRWDAATASFVTGDPDSIGSVGEHGEGTALHYDDFARLHSGGSWVLMAYKGDTYLESTDASGWVTSWIVRAKGSGTLACYDEYDEDWAYALPANSLGNIVVSGSDWTDYEMPTTSFSIADLMGEGACKLGLSLSGGSSVDVDVVYLRIWPPAGPLGGWQPKLDETTQAIPQVSVVGNGVGPTGGGTTYYEFDPEDDGGAGFSTAYAEMLTDVASSPEDESRESQVDGRGYMSTNTGTEVLSSLGGTEHVGRWAYRMTYMVIDLGDLDRFQPSDFMGTDVEGVDWIRRPDRCEFDLKAWYDYTLPGVGPELGSWLNTDARLVGYRNIVGTRLEDWPTGPGAHAVTVNYDDYPYDLPPATPSSRAPVLSYPFPQTGDRFELNDTSSGGAETDETVALTLPLQPKFMMSMGNTFTTSIPPQSSLRIISFSGASVVQTATLYLRWDSESEAQLIGVVDFPPFRVWSPSGAVSWVRWRGRPDGLGLSTYRARSHSSWQASNRVRGIR